MNRSVGVVEPHFGKHPGEGRVVGQVDGVVGRDVLVQLDGDGHELLGAGDEEQRNGAADLNTSQHTHTTSHRLIHNCCKCFDTHDQSQ